jgi:hypothetical protein
MKHKHHITPKHRGGTNDQSNLVEITLTQHAMFHYCEWKLHGKRADYVAWKRLVGNLNDEELVYQKLVIGGEKGGRKTKELGVGIFALSKEEKSKHSKKSGKIGGKIGGMSRSEKKINACRENIKKAVKVFMENDTTEKAKERGIKGNKSQREKFENEGKTIAEQIWIITTPNGEKIQIENLKKFCRENNLLPNKMCEVGKGKWKQHRGYSCEKIRKDLKQSSDVIKNV